MKGVAVALALIAAGEAAALSCAPPDPVASFVQLSEVPEPYVVWLGQMAFDEGLLPEGIDNDPPPPPPIPARFVGRGLTPEGFTNPVAAAVTLQPVCLGPWCGGAASGETVMAFVRMDGAVPLIEAGPCGGRIFPDPSEADIAAVTACIRGETCVPPKTFD